MNIDKQNKHKSENADDFGQRYVFQIVQDVTTCDYSYPLILLFFVSFLWVRV